MILLRCSVVASSLLVMACSSASRSPSPAPSNAARAMSRNGLAHVVVDLSAFPRTQRPLDDALHAATAVVLGIRHVEDACGTYVDLRMFPEVHLGGSEVTEPHEEDDSNELRALLYLPN